MQDDTHDAPYKGKFKPRPTVYNGITMRSRLEAAWAEQFDAFGWGWEYEPICVASKAGQYLPDFRLQIPGALGDVYVEVKPGSWVDMENWGFGGDVYDMDGPAGWNTACDRRSAEINRMAAAVSANVPMHAFLLCLGAGGEHEPEQVGILHAGTDETLVPVRCDDCTHAFLVRHPLTIDLDYRGTFIVSRRMCPDHRSTLDVPIPVASLYAARGWAYFGGRYERDAFDLMMRGE